MASWDALHYAPLLYDWKCLISSGQPLVALVILLSFHVSANFECCVKYFNSVHGLWLCTLYRLIDCLYGELFVIPSRQWSKYSVLPLQQFFVPSDATLAWCHNRSILFLHSLSITLSHILKVTFFVSYWSLCSFWVGNVRIMLISSLLLQWNSLQGLVPFCCWSICHSQWVSLMKRKERSCKARTWKNLGSRRLFHLGYRYGSCFCPLYCRYSLSLTESQSHAF